MDKTRNIIVILLSGGTGTRSGGTIPKQYVRKEGRMMISYALDRLLSLEGICRIQIVAAPEWREEIRGECPEALFFSDPGENRQLSIRNALTDLEGCAGPEDIVLVHDAARPYVSKELLKRVIDACDTYDGAMPVLPMKDTVYLSEDGSRVSALLEREKIFAGQAPEAFKYGKYLKANRDLTNEQILAIKGSTEVAIGAGMDIALVEGEESNCKITSKMDLERFLQE